MGIFQKSYFSRAEKYLSEHTNIFKTSVQSLENVSTYFLKRLYEGVVLYQLPLLKFQELKYLREFYKHFCK